MYELIHCGGYTYGERPEVWSPSNRHPRNFSDELGHEVKIADCEIEYVSEWEWIHTPKFHFHPNYKDYPA